MIVLADRPDYPDAKHLAHDAQLAALHPRSGKMAPAAAVRRRS